MSEHARPLAGRRVLIVEDEYLIAIEVKRWLRTAGATVAGPVPSAEQAFDLIEDESIDAAVLDLNLGDGDTAYPVADRLAALGVPYLFATGDMRVADTSAYRGRPRLEKPYLEAELIHALSDLLK